MQRRRRKLIVPLVIATAAGLVLVAGAVVFIRAGVYNVGADDPHYPVTYAVLEQLRRASVQTRASELDVPKDLMNPARITQGAGNYSAMCAQCHLAPGMAPTELSKGLYPAPPNLSREVVDAAEAFWVIKHGIKASGMPAWGGSMADEYVWNLAAFVRQLPRLNASQYQALVASSRGHSHGGGETMPHHDADMPPGGGHPHAPGTVEHDDGAGAAAGHPHAPGTPPHVDATAKPAHVDPPGAPPHTH
ncbi:MAG: c-type cytochrome [Pseudomonadota bacterium]